MKDYVVKKERKSNSRILLYTLFTVIMLFIGIQLYVLTSVGVQGEKINQIKDEQSKLKIENEIKQAEIQTLQSRNEILDSIEELGMEETDVTLISTHRKTASKQ